MASETQLRTPAQTAQTPAGRKQTSGTYALVQDRSTDAYFILETDERQWHGPYATRLEAELTLVAWLA